MARYVDHERHERIAAGLRELAGTEVGAGATFSLDYPQQIGPTASWFRLQAARVDASDRIIVTHTDISERVLDQQALAWQASHDDLTGLPNRARCCSSIGEALDGSPSRAALLFLDLDGFKTVNDSLGHEVGDELLRRWAARLPSRCARGRRGRLGADQFLVWPGTATPPRQPPSPSGCRAPSPVPSTPRASRCRCRPASASPSPSPAPTGPTSC
jgi:hypothetical protein